MSCSAEQNYSELCDGLLAFLFRDGLKEDANVQLHFPAARVPQDFGLKLLKVSYRVLAGIAFLKESKDTLFCQITLLYCQK